MSTTIIILGVLILIVIIAIIVVLITGKSSKEDNKQEDSGMTFKDDSTDTNIPEPQPEVVTPQLHQQVPITQPVQNAPVLNDLNTPIQSTQPQTTTPIDQSPINQPNPLPDVTQMENDMANLQNSMNEPNPAPVIPTPEVSIPESSISNTPEDTNNTEMTNLSNSINSQTEEQPLEQIDIPTPEIADNTAGVPTIDQIPTAPNTTTIPNEQITPMEQETSAIDLDNPVINELTPQPEIQNPLPNNDNTNTPIVNSDTPVTTPPITQI